MRRGAHGKPAVGRGRTGGSMNQACNWSIGTPRPILSASVTGFHACLCGRPCREGAAERLTRRRRSRLASPGARRRRALTGTAGKRPPPAPRRRAAWAALPRPRRVLRVDGEGPLGGRGVSLSQTSRALTRTVWAPSSSAHSSAARPASRRTRARRRAAPTAGVRLVVPTRPRHLGGGASCRDGVDLLLRRGLVEGAGVEETQLQFDAALGGVASSTTMARPRRSTASSSRGRAAARPPATARAAPR